MQGLKTATAWVALSLALPLAAQSNDWVSHDLGSHPVARACPAIGSVPVQGQQAQRNVSTWAGGQISLGLRAWPEPRLKDRQRIKQFESCVRKGAGQLSSAQLVGAERAAEEALQAAIGRCLAEEQRDFTVRTVVLRRGSVRCPG